jgi:hypothetical protein
MCEFHEPRLFCAEIHSKEVKEDAFENIDPFPRYLRDLRVPLPRTGRSRCAVVGDELRTIGAF